MGVDPYLPHEPYTLLGRVGIAGISFAVYDLALLTAALLLGIAAWRMLERTRQGKLLRVVIHDREIAAAMGIDVGRMFTLTFAVGAMLGALAGAMTAPGIDRLYVIERGVLSPQSSGRPG
jgi:branched-chain amino acid transport system permease protein